MNGPATRILARRGRAALVGKADGEQISIKGAGTIVDREHHAKNNMVFDQWGSRLAVFFLSSEEGNCWILRVDPDHRYAVVGTPDRGYLWILVRTLIF